MVDRVDPRLGFSGESREKDEAGVAWTNGRMIRERGTGTRRRGREQTEKGGNEEEIPQPECHKKDGKLD